MLAFLCALAAPSLAFADPSLRLYHRLWIPSSSPPPFSLRANIQLSSEFGPILVAPDQPADILLITEHSEESLYQVALEREGDLEENDWDWSSIKACHLTHAESDIINLQASSSDRLPYALDYFVHPVPRDGRCPKKTYAPQTAITFTNTTLTFQFASAPPLPELRVPPPLSPKGEPIQPEPEQSFLQKYWMYIGIAMLTLMMAGGGAPEEEQAGQGQGRPVGRVGAR